MVVVVSVDNDVDNLVELCVDVLVHHHRLNVVVIGLHHFLLAWKLLLLLDRIIWRCSRWRPARSVHWWQSRYVSVGLEHFVRDRAVIVVAVSLIDDGANERISRHIFAKFSWRLKLCFSFFCFVLSQVKNVKSSLVELISYKY